MPNHQNKIDRRLSSCTLKDSRDVEELSVWEYEDVNGIRTVSIEVASSEGVITVGVQTDPRNLRSIIDTLEEVDMKLNSFDVEDGETDRNIEEVQTLN